MIKLAKDEQKLFIFLLDHKEYLIVTLLKDIQNDAIDSSIEISTLLRKCKVLAVRLKSEEFGRWVDMELSGYKSVDELPDYRVMKVISKGHFSGPFNSGLKNADIPLFCIPDDLKEHFEYSKFPVPVIAIQSLIDDCDSGTANEPWPAEVVALLGEKIYEGMNCMQAWKVIPVSKLVSMIDAVRNRILNFVLKIESQNPNAGEAEPNSIPVPKDQVHQIFNTYISGDVQNVATGSTNVSQSGKFIVNKGDIDSLSNYLKSNGVSSDDISELENAIKKDSELGSPNEMGPEKMSWIANMYNKAASGAWKVSASVATNTLTKGINDYLGL